MPPSSRLPLIVLAMLTISAAWAGLSCGASCTAPSEIWRALVQRDADSLLQTVLWSIRLPRVLLALAVGAALAQSGAVLQALFRNPLADPSLLGISGGASLGVAIAIIILPSMSVAISMVPALVIPLAATLGGLMAVTVVMLFARKGGTTQLTTLLLAGISINALAGAGLVLLQTLANDAALRDLTTWLFGNLGRAGWPQLTIVLPLLLLIILWLPRDAAQLDVLLLGETEAAHIGIEVDQLKRRLLLLVVAATATATAVAGIIGFVGLIVPHWLRAHLGARHAVLLPGVALLGASMLTLADTAARCLFSPYELPVGVLTALVGVPFFLMVLRQQRLPA